MRRHDKAFGNESPPYVKKGDFVAIVCTGRYVMPDQLQEAVRFFISSGLRVKTGFTAGRKKFQLGGTPEERAADFNAFLADPDVRAVFVARGGFGHLDIVDRIDWSLLKKDPKWVCGFSDVTVLHAHIQSQTGLPTLHCTMPGMFSGDNDIRYSVSAIKSTLSGISPKGIPAVTGRKGTAEGVLTGGNLSVLHCLSGSISEPDYSGKILFVEEVDEYLYHIDRMFACLKRAGKLERLKGLIAGSFTEIRDHDEPFGESVQEIILRHTASYDYPVVFNFPAGHQPHNEPLVLGNSYSLHAVETSAVVRMKQ